MRIGSGVLKGRSLRVPPGVRPSEGRVREALFNLWQMRVPGSRFLDLFAGSGAVAIEALSRGAAAAVLVERSGRVFKVVEANCKLLIEGAQENGALGHWTIYRFPLPAGLSSRPLADQDPFDLVFADPPYDFDDWAGLLERIAPRLAPAGVAALEHSRRNPPPATGGGLTRRSSRRYGESVLSFYES